MESFDFVDSSTPPNPPRPFLSPFLFWVQLAQKVHPRSWQLPAPQSGFPGAFFCAKKGAEPPEVPTLSERGRQPSPKAPSILPAVSKRGRGRFTPNLGIELGISSSCSRPQCGSLTPSPADPRCSRPPGFWEKPACPCEMSSPPPAWRPPSTSPCWMPRSRPPG